MSKDTVGCRLKLEIKPITATRVAQPEEILRLMQFAFNFHLDLKDRPDPVAGILPFLAQWDEVRDEAERIIHSVREE